MFVDETERGGHLLAATLVAPAALHSTRSLMRGLLLPGERRVHFKSEKDSRRKYIVSRIVERGLEVIVLSSSEKGDRARAVLLERLVVEAIERGVSRLVLDSRDHASNGRDRGVLARTKARDAGIVYEHIQSSAEPALWVSDAVAWCSGAGGDWRRRIGPVVTRIEP
ncbi:hypothetical protein SAMN05216188_10421 [Lentzea xinjiangensis]|uniref:DUF3800 domain-containing protein n=2 Tax=Lentzea xinjiangensis TaxID=402600 RepID=A0A1H9HFX5_9PSEU|nr:hypothetical protein SAMN05216188_10421 [Lentzea xinjiangensis]